MLKYIAIGSTNDALKELVRGGSAGEGRKVGASAEAYEAGCAGEGRKTGSAEDRRAGSAAEGYEAGCAALCISDRQEAGRGRMGRSFFSPEGGLYFSLLISRLELPAEKALRLTPAAAVFLCEALEETLSALPEPEKPEWLRAWLSSGESLSPLKIKWVNDVYLNGLKVAGILTEAVPLPSGSAASAEKRESAYIVGIGVDLRLDEAALPEELIGKAGSLELPKCVSERSCSDEDSIKYALARSTAEKLLAFCASKEPEAAWSAVLESYRRRSLLTGRKLYVSSLFTSGTGAANEKKAPRLAEALGEENGSEAPRLAEALGTDEECGLVVRYEDGSVAVLRSGEVSLSPLPPSRA